MTVVPPFTGPASRVTAPPKVAAAALGARDADALARVVTAAFTKRRKTLRNALGGVIDESGLHSLGIDPRLRPENLGVDEYVRIANAISCVG